MRSQSEVDVGGIDSRRAIGVLRIRTLDPQTAVIFGQLAVAAVGIAIVSVVLSFG
jgi:hypothetical protein